MECLVCTEEKEYFTKKYWQNYYNGIKSVTHGLNSGSDWLIFDFIDCYVVYNRDIDYSDNSIKPSSEWKYQTAIDKNKDTDLDFVLNLENDLNKIYNNLKNN